MEQIQVWLGNPKYVTALAAFLAAVIAAFVAGYVLGRTSRPRGMPPVARPAPRRLDDVEPLPEIGGEEARLMDLTAIRAAESEPPRPPIPERPRRR